MTSILQISDLQFGVEDTHAMALVRDFALETRPDLCLICGDITQSGKVSEFKDAAEWIKTLPGIKLITPGNHDTPMFNVPYRAIAPFYRYKRYILPLSEPFYADENIMIVTHNTARGLQFKFDWSLGVVDLQQLSADITALHGASPGTLKMIAVHHPLLYPPGVPLQKKTKNGPEAIKALSDANIDGVFSGHVHAPFMIGRDPGKSALISIGSGTLSRRTRGKPAGFNHIDIDKETLTVTPYYCTDSEYIPQDIWSAPRGSLPPPLPYAEV